MRFDFTFCSLLLLVFVFGFAGNKAYGDTFFESTDTSNFLTGAINVGNGIDQIVGVLDSNTDHDLWEVTFSDSLVVEFYLGDSSFDDNLLLFNEFGQGLEGDDDGGMGLDSRIERFLEAGTYYIGVGPNNMAGFTDNGIEFIDDDSGPLGQPTTETLGFIDREFGTIHGAAGASYTLTLSVPTSGVPEPTAFTVILLVGTSLFGRRSRT